MCYLTLNMFNVASMSYPAEIPSQSISSHIFTSITGITCSVAALVLAQSSSRVARKGAYIPFFEIPKSKSLGCEVYLGGGGACNWCIMANPLIWKAAIEEIPDGIQIVKWCAILHEINISVSVILIDLLVSGLFATQVHIPFMIIS